MKKGIKYDHDRLRWDLLPMECVEEIVKIYSFGSKKYSDNSWQNVENGRERYYAALMRHLVAWRKGERIDPESGELHISHMAWNAIALIYLELKEVDKNDLYNQKI